MKTEILFAALMALAIQWSRATLYTWNSDELNTVIPDGNLVGITSSHTISGYTSPGGQTALGNVDVNLNISGGFNGDLFGYLTFQSADSSITTVVLLNQVGMTESNPFGYRDAGMIVTLSSSGSTSIHDYGGNSGAQFTPNEPYLPDSGAVTLANLNGKNINGTWTLFLADLSGGDTSFSSLVSWGLELEVVPEPANIALGVFAVCAISVVAARTRWKIKKQNKVKTTP